MRELFQFTMEYSNAVLTAFLPLVNQATDGLDLPITRPVQPAHVRTVRAIPVADTQHGVILLTNGFTFGYNRGIIYRIEAPDCYFALQDPDEIPRFYGTLRCTKEQAINVGLNAIASLGHDVSHLKKLKPQIEGPFELQGKTVPRYRVSWPGPPDFAGPTAQVEVDGEKRRIKMVRLNGKEFSRPAPRIAVTPPVIPKPTNTEAAGGIRLEPVTDEQRRQILAKVLPEFSNYSKRMGIAVPPLFSTNQLMDVECWQFMGNPHVQIITTNGYRLTFHGGFVSSFYAPDAFFGDDWKRYGTNYDYFVGSLPTKRDDLIESARRAIANSGHFKDMRRFQQKPVFAGGPDPDAKVGLTRFLYYWFLDELTVEEQKQTDMMARPVVAVEVDARSREPKSLYISETPARRK